MKDEDLLGPVMLGGIIVIFVVWVLPIAIAFWREHPNRWPIFIVTVIFGGTGLGWLVALVWSLHGIHRSKGEIVNGGESGLNLYANDRRPAVIIDSTPRVAADGDQEIMPKRDRSISWAAGRLERIGRLRAENALTDEEYAAMKTEILRG